jgi:hypothetical protein
VAKQIEDEKLKKEAEEREADFKKTGKSTGDKKGGKGEDKKKTENKAPKDTIPK